MKTYLVLGAGGFLGKSLCAGLLNDENVHIIAFDKNLSGLKPLHGSKRLELVEGDFFVIDSISSLISRSDVVFHLIGTTFPQEGTEHISSEIIDNLVPTVRLMEELVRLEKTVKLVYLSSGGTVYGNAPVATKRTTDSLEPICSYGALKQAIEAYISFYGRYKGLDYMIARVSNPYGINKDRNRKQGLISTCMNRLITNDPIVMRGNTVRDYIYVDDMVDALILLSKYKGNMRVLNIGSGVGYSTRDIISSIEQVTGRTFSEIKHSTTLEHEVDSVILDIEETKRELHWSPRIDLQQGLYKMWEQIIESVPVVSLNR